MATELQMHDEISRSLASMWCSLRRGGIESPGYRRARQTIFALLETNAQPARVVESVAWVMRNLNTLASERTDGSLDPRADAGELAKEVMASEARIFQATRKMLEANLRLVWSRKAISASCEPSKSSSTAGTSSSRRMPPGGSARL